ncbi:acetyltransferase [Lederbergia galactosidilytica]|uniref:Acetyltransferase n=1 Tax=Lederbergia galactosidilytica TaxID=217031 RepID=A0A177ZJW2_9BACI|nr:acetyltransferase [Lederbergia galactosidilytica]OAK67630.1 acetyltransferase [Lederbergia galactosidilytica]
MKEKLLIIGASGHGKVVADIAIKMNKWQTVDFLDDDGNIKAPMGLNVIGTTQNVSKYIDEYEIFVGIGNNNIRQKIFNFLVEEGASIPLLIHPDAIIAKQVIVGEGTVIMPGAIINSSSKIGKGCILNTASTIDHDNSIKDFVHISPGVHLAGNVNVGTRSWLGIGSIVSNNLSITKDCKIGAGAVVVNDITETGTYVGVPARRL